mmetsp:Transcript_59144/g.183365  ORF Transcript_59144/g.183365 Transcript_59144/m.183365 type:complete len:309 (-) Transcript_59144:17-943(-)
MRSCGPSPPTWPHRSGSRRGGASARPRASQWWRTSTVRTPGRTATAAAPRTPAAFPRPRAATAVPAADLRQAARARPGAGWRPKPAASLCCGSRARCRHGGLSVRQRCHHKAPGGTVSAPASRAPSSSREAARTASRATSATCAPLGRRRCASRRGSLSSAAPACGRCGNRFAARGQQPRWAGAGSMGLAVTHCTSAVPRFQCSQQSLLFCRQWRGPLAEPSYSSLAAGPVLGRRADAAPLCASKEVRHTAARTFQSRRLDAQWLRPFFAAEVLCPKHGLHTRVAARVPCTLRRSPQKRDIKSSVRAI